MHAMRQSTRSLSGDTEDGDTGDVAQQSQLDAAMVSDRPALAADVALMGQMQGTGFKDAQWLALRGGTFLQLSELLYRVAEQINGERTLEEIAARLTADTEWLVSADQVRQIIAAKLVPLRLVELAAQAPAADDTTAASPAGARSAEPSSPLVRSPLRLNLRAAILGPRVIDPIVAVLKVLFWPPLLVALLGLVALAHWWVYARHGIGNAILATLYTPGLLLAVVLILFAGSVVHEFGHASALRYGGGRARGIGAGLYLIYPVLYTDTTDSYRLGRGGRVRTDLGGMYFHLLFALGIVGLYQVTHLEFLLILVLLIDLDIVRQWIPFVRLDGYWAISDLVGIPDLLSGMTPFARSLVPAARAGGPRMPRLKRWVAAVYLLYIVATLPVLALLTFAVVKSVPAFVAYTGNALLMQSIQFHNALDVGNAAVMALAIVQALMLLAGLVGLAAMLVGMARAPVAGLWRWSQAAPLRRAAGGAVALGGLALLAYFWLPQIGATIASPPEVQSFQLLAGGVVAIGGVVFLAYPWIRRLGDSERLPAGVRSFRVASHREVSGRVHYAQTPPVGGDHWSDWQNSGFYDTSVEPERAVHSMEHGAIWITYRPDLPRDEADQLRAIAAQRDDVIVSPFPGLPAPVVASAWARQLRLASARDPRLVDFIETFWLGAQAPDAEEPRTDGYGVPAEGTAVG